MASIFQKNQQANKSLITKASTPSVESKDDLFSKSSKLQNLGELKFPGSDDSKMAKAESLEKSLNDIGGTAIKIGLKGIVALNKAQQQLEDRTSQRAMRMNTNKPNQSTDPLANLLAILAMLGSSKMFKRFGAAFSRRFKSRTISQKQKSDSRKQKQKQ